MNTATTNTSTNSNTAEDKEAAHRRGAVSGAVMAYFLLHGNACTIKELATHMERSEAWIRKVMNENHGCPRDVTIRDGYRESHSKSYPGMTAGHHKVSEYQPTMEAMRAKIISMQGSK